MPAPPILPSTRARRPFAAKILTGEIHGAARRRVAGELADIRPAPHLHLIEVPEGDFDAAVGAIDAVMFDVFGEGGRGGEEGDAEGKREGDAHGWLLGVKDFYRNTFELLAGRHVAAAPDYKRNTKI